MYCIYIPSFCVSQRLKSEVAAESVKEMNPYMNITAHQNRVCPETEEVYTHSFYSILDGVAAALDNVDAREFKLCTVYDAPTVFANQVCHLTQNDNANLYICV